jgi:hypothetical protein
MLNVQQTEAESREQKCIERFCVQPAIVDEKSGIDGGAQPGQQTNAPAEEVASEQVCQQSGARAQAAEQKAIIDICASEEHREPGD